MRPGGRSRPPAARAAATTPKPPARTNATAQPDTPSVLSLRPGFGVTPQRVVHLRDQITAWASRRDAVFRQSRRSRTLGVRMECREARRGGQ